MPALAALAALLLLAGCASLAPATRPALVVVLVVDGLPQWQVQACRPHFGADGFARFLERGAWFADAQVASGYTVTASGHAAILTGAYPHATGIIGNQWRDRATLGWTHSAADPQAQPIGHAAAEGDSTSPRNLLAESLGDVLRRHSPGSRVLSVAGKDRSAILPAGRAGTAYMYMDASGRFASTTWYMERHPAWVDAFNAARPADAFFRAAWAPMLGEGGCSGEVLETQPWYAVRRPPLPRRFSAEADGAPGPAFYKAIEASPFIDALTLSFARAAVDAERLGQGDATDLLIVGLSGHDTVNHGDGAESRTSQDHLVHLDGLLQDFFAGLDRSVGRERYLAVLTSDHGFMPPPEATQARGLPAGKLQPGAMLARINAGLEQRFGVPRLVHSISASALLLGRAAMAERGLDPAAVEGAARELLLQEPGIAAAFTRTELLTGAAHGRPFFTQVRRSWHAGRSGDVQYVLQPHWMLASTAMATHGSPHAYDTHVPLMLWGPSWTSAGRRDGPAEIVDIAPTLARLLGLPAPAQSEGRVLPAVRR